ncbi:MAG: hypothetical protein OEW08_05415, partial [Gammaproteobacteria bacterium]|nr:hypothetical protein [Gammaproteobacteria bacterium]
SINREKRTGQFGLNIMEGQHRYAYPQGLPGYLLVEAMAQSSGLLLRAVTTEAVEGDNAGYLVGVENARLPNVVPNLSSLILDVKLHTAAAPIFCFFVSIFSGQENISSSEIQIMTRRVLNVEYSTKN